MKKLPLLLLAISSTFLASPAIYAHSGAHPVRYIAEDGEDSGNCSKPTSPCKTIAYTVNQSSKGDKIHVAQGQYHAKEMDVFYLLNDMVEIKAGYSTRDNFKTLSLAKNKATIVGIPAEYRERLAKKGFRLLADTKGNEQYTIKPEYLKMLERYKKITSQKESQTDCVSGVAGEYSCNKINLQSHLPLSQMSSTPTSANDIWGYRDLNNGREYAVVGLKNGTIVVDVSDPTDPKEVGTVSGISSTWRDVKVYQHLDATDNTYKAYAYVTTEASQGFQILDLTKAPNSISLANTINVFTSAHNVYLGNTDYATGLANEGQSAYLYIAGSNNGNGSYRIFDLLDPKNPKLITTPPSTGYVHDATNLTISDSRTSQCASGHNPCELFIDFNEKEVDIWDTTDKAAPTKVSSTPYTNASYTHSGWYSRDKNFIFVQDELDEQQKGVNTTLYVMDISNLSSPSIVGSYVGPTKAIDHNGFTLGDKYYMSNYKRGLTVLDVSTPATPVEIGMFDTYPVPAANDAQFDGAWGTYPYLPSGNILISDISNGLFVVADKSGTAPTQVGTIDFEKTSDTLAEANSSFSIAVSRLAGSKGAISVDYATQAATAVAGEDFSAASGTLTWEDGESGTKNIQITLLDDAVEEAAESLALVLSNVQGGATLSNSSYTLNIKASDGPVAVQNGQLGLSSSSVSVEENSGSISISVDRTIGADGEVSVAFATQDGSAIAGQDYSASSGTLTWADGDSATKTISVSITDDSAQENSEDFSLVLSSVAGGATLGLSTYSVTINASDQPAVTPPPSNSGGGGGPIMPITLLGLMGLHFFRKKK